MSRSLWKPVYIDSKIANQEKNLTYTLYNRNLTILPEYLGLSVKIYNGIRFYEIIITEKMFGYKFGEFSSTRRYPKNKKKK